ncbi:MAG: NAD-dependent epimerase/dehydratase family protein [Chloroflexi bacterium]|nr:NAD-dependent epimerase/dehydratase family protein [Chloroflexota bacterium]MCA2000884.1 NAD-dependent epimerase/dehydratase family protein [Chloroflexota bacterium]
MTRYFITGGFGFLGQHIVQALHAHDPQGQLRVLTRTPRKTFLNLQALERVQWTRGELTQPESFAEHLAGVDTVIHNAAMVSFAKADAQKVFDANVIGTRNLAQAARAAGCRNFVFISSISALDFRPPQITDETFFPDLELKKKFDVYGYSKRLSEIELGEMKDDMRVVILNPSVILGPGSERATAAIRAIRKFPVLPMMDYVNAFVDVRDVARAVILSLARGRSGERYIVSAHNIRMVEFARIAAAALQKNIRVLPLSPAGLKLADGAVALLDALNLNPGLRRPSQMNIDKPCSHEKIKAEMGWEPAFTLEESIRDSVRASAE